MLVEPRVEILDGQSPCLFSNEPFEKRPGMTIEDFGLHSDDHFESHLRGNGLCHETSDVHLRRTVRLERMYYDASNEHLKRTIPLERIYYKKRKENVHKTFI